MATTRKSIAEAADTIVVKIGTRVLTDPTGALDLDRVSTLAGQLAEAVDAGRQVVLVSSGAVGAGLGRLGLGRRPSDLAELQAVASVGQSGLIEAYNRALENYGHHAAQVLLTADDFADRSRYLNVRNTLFALFRLRAVPIVNENDAVRVDELQRNFGDNDRLAAMVTNLLRAPLLILLSDVEGVYDRSGSEADGANLLTEIDLTADAAGDLVFEHTVGGGNTKEGPQLSRGGMRSKLEAARLVTTAGERAIIASGRRDRVLTDILAGRDVGTLIVGPDSAVNSRKRWISSVARCKGQLAVDAGAARALREQGSSLLAIGITAVEGEFGKGDVVAITGPAGDELARGLSNYSSAEVRDIAGKPTEQFGEILGHSPYEEVVHRDNLALLV
ncbi:MAG: glutamate 5-kinase [Aeoliella sp.]